MVDSLSPQFPHRIRRIQRCDLNAHTVKSLSMFVFISRIWVCAFCMPENTLYNWALKNKQSFRAKHTLLLSTAFNACLPRRFVSPSHTPTPMYGNGFVRCPGLPLAISCSYIHYSRSKRDRMSEREYNLFIKSIFLHACATETVLWIWCAARSWIVYSSRAMEQQIQQLPRMWMSIVFRIRYVYFIFQSFVINEFFFFCLTIMSFECCCLLDMLVAILLVCRGWIHIVGPQSTHTQFRA